MAPIDETAREQQLQALVDALSEEGEPEGGLSLISPELILWLIRRGRAFGERIAELEKQQNRALVVPSLPAHAPAGTLLVTAGDTNIYVGTGPNTPLRRVATQALP